MATDSSSRVRKFGFGCCVFCADELLMQHQAQSASTPPGEVTMTTILSPGIDETRYKSNRASSPGR